MAGTVDVASMSPTVEVVLISLDWIGWRLWAVSIVVAAESVLIASVVAAVTILVIVSIVVIVVVLLAAVAIAALMLVLLLRLIIEVACVERWRSIIGRVGVMAELLLHGLQLLLLLYVGVREIVDRCLVG